MAETRSRAAARGRVALCIALLCALVRPTAAAPFRITRDSVVEGSTVAGGLQPDYLVRLDDENLAPVLERARQIAVSTSGYWPKVRRIRALVHRSLPRGSYTNPDYLSLMARYRDSRRPVPIGEYVKLGVGVCRENALVLHLALAAAGIDNQVVYASVDYDHLQEDHAFVVLKGGVGDGWTVDAYNPDFNGLRLSDLLKPGGVRVKDPIVAALTRPRSVKRFIRALTPYPRVTPARTPLRRPVPRPPSVPTRAPAPRR